PPWHPGLGVGVTGPGSNGSLRATAHLHYNDQHGGRTEGVLLGRSLAGQRSMAADLRNDQFTNYNSDHVEYVDSGDQWAPRFGASWAPSAILR
ncbi:hypothetical protein, partial [Xanthomonas axonopodis]